MPVMNTEYGLSVPDLRMGDFVNVMRDGAVKIAQSPMPVVNMDNGM